MEKDILVWLEQAERDLKSAEHNIDSKDYYVSALLAQQAVEKGLKFLILKNSKKLPRIHDLVKLAKKVTAPIEIIQRCIQINPVYVEVRYPIGSELPADKVSQEEAESILGSAKEIIKWVKNQN